MFRGYDLSVPENCFEDYEADGQSAFEAQKAKIKSILGSFKDDNGALIASRGCYAPCTRSAARLSMMQTKATTWKPARVAA